MEYLLWKVPILKIDQKLKKHISKSTGEINFEFVGRANEFNDIPLLYRENGTPVSAVNNWLIYLKSSRHRKQVDTQAQALLHYFSLLDRLNLEWDVMPIASRNKPTYQFSKHLRSAVISGTIAKTTATNYLGSVVNFYKFYLAKGYKFINPPFNYETVKVSVKGSHEFMRDRIIYVNTTDLRLNLPKDSSFGGISRALVPLSESEWKSVNEICVKGKVISNKNNQNVLVNLSEESKFAIMLARYTGLRRAELTTFRANFIYKPSGEQLRKKYLIHTEGILISPSLGVKTKGSVARTIEFPSSLMMSLHKYINSKRYIKRRKLFEINYPKESKNPPLLITQSGHYYTSQTINARWGEIRNTVRKEYPQFNHKFHNLRSTYAVFRLKELLNKGLKEGDALDYIQSVMGHKSRATLLMYLKFCKEKNSANEIFEQALELVIKD